MLASAYLLPPGRMLEALEDAARRGAHVTVRIEGRPQHDPRGALKAINEAAVRRLRRFGADAQLVDATDAGGPALHMKAVVCDGIAYLDDRNFTATGQDAVLRIDSPQNVAAVSEAVRGLPHRACRSFWTSKGSALRAEARMLQAARASQAVEVESESFGTSSGVYGALKNLAQHGSQCRLIVARRELTARASNAIARLERAGVQVRASAFNEKFALAGAQAWVGSANATTPFYDGDQIDWGLRTRSRAVTAMLHSRFETQWAHARPVRCDPATTA